MIENAEQKRIADMNLENMNKAHREEQQRELSYLRDETARLSRVVEQQARLAEWIAQLLEQHTDGLTHSEKRGALKLIASMMRQYFRAFHGIEVPNLPEDTNQIPF